MLKVFNIYLSIYQAAVLSEQKDFTASNTSKSRQIPQTLSLSATSALSYSDPPQEDNNLLGYVLVHFKNKNNNNKTRGIQIWPACTGG